jgi:hypothetical protein
MFKAVNHWRLSIPHWLLSDRPPLPATISRSTTSASTPPRQTVPARATVIWTNHDGIPHNIAGTGNHFASPVLDTEQRYSLLRIPELIRTAAQFIPG